MTSLLFLITNLVPSLAMGYGVQQIVVNTPVGVFAAKNSSKQESIGNFLGTIAFCSTYCSLLYLFY